MNPFTILFVDDDPGVLASLKRITRNADFQPLFATSGHEALERLEAIPVHMVVSDHKMPEMGGTELISRVRLRFPHVIRVLFSGYADMKTLVDAINLGEVFRFIPKPWDIEEFHRIIGECREEYERRHQDHLVAAALNQVPVPVMILQPEVGFVTYCNKPALEWLTGGKTAPPLGPAFPGAASVGFSLDVLGLEVRPTPGQTWAQLLETQPVGYRGEPGRWVALELDDYPGHRRLGLVWRAEHHG